MAIDPSHIGPSHILYERARQGCSPVDERKRPRISVLEQIRYGLLLNAARVANGLPFIPSAYYGNLLNLKKSGSDYIKTFLEGNPWARQIYPLELNLKTQIPKTGLDMETEKVKYVFMDDDGTLSPALSFLKYALIGLPAAYWGFIYSLATQKFATFPSLVASANVLTRFLIVGGIGLFVYWILDKFYEPLLRAPGRRVRDILQNLHEKV
jgi:hypothetical protein